MSKWLLNDLIAFAAPLSSWRGLRVQRRIPTLALDGRSPCPMPPLPSLSIIVPARNEAENLRRLLPSLKRIIYPGSVEVIVVDDGSTDETAEIAGQHQTTLLQLQTLPDGWLGKPHIWLKVVKVEGMAVMLGLFCLLLAFFLLQAPLVWFAVWTGNTLILAWKHHMV